MQTNVFKDSSLKSLFGHWAIKPMNENSKDGSLLAHQTNKLSISKLLRNKSISACPTKSFKSIYSFPWLPCCIKPVNGSGAHGFKKFFSNQNWEVAQKFANCNYVIQPLLNGIEYRITIINGNFKIAQLIERKGDFCCWRQHKQNILSESVKNDLFEIQDTLKLFIVGFDIIVEQDTWYVIDINPNSALSPHFT